MKAPNRGTAFAPVRGKAHLYGDNLDTDGIIPGRHCNSIDEAELGRHCLEDVDSAFVGRVARGDVVVAGKNFGCGSSREVAVLALRGAGVSCVLAASFARIFYRNAVNLGFPALVSAEAHAAVKTGDTLSIDLVAGRVTNETTGATFGVTPPGELARTIAEAGGLLALAARGGLDEP